MKYENVKFDKEARDKIIQGVELATKAVSTTYGPNGFNVLYKYMTSLKSTKDGASVIQIVNDPDPFIQMGIDVIKEASVKTAKTVGDGSTTVAILANAIIQEFKDNPTPIQLCRELRKECEDIDKQLSLKKQIISDKSDLLKVATLSANNDSIIGNIIAEAFDKVGKDGLVTFQESNDVKDKIEYSKGFRIDNGYESPYFVNNSKNECVLEDVIIYISDTKLEESKEIHDLAGKAYKENKGLLLIAPEFDSALTMFLVRNLFNSDGTQRLKSCMVISPNFGAMRDIIIEDMKILFNTEMHCDKVIISKDNTTFIGYNPDQIKLKNRIESVREIIKENNISEIELNFHKKRLANFTSGMATIYVGGYSQVEMKERLDRYEDAIMATQCALDGGVLPGGGTALNEVSGNLLKNILKIPLQILNTKIKTSKDAFENNVIEPYLVVKTTLENAISVASTILTTNCVILNI